jgi:hypothetical protein
VPEHVNFIFRRRVNMLISRTQMTGSIIEIVRAACVELGITHGAIGVGVELAVRNRAMFEWFESPENANLELSIASITGDGDTLCYDKDGKVTENGAGIVMGMVAGLQRWVTICEREYRLPITRDIYTSAAIPDDSIMPGDSNRKGAVAINVGMLDGIGCARHGRKAFTVYVAVAGGTDEENEKAAWSALGYIRDEVIDYKDGFMLERIFYDH